MLLLLVRGVHTTSPPEICVGKVAARTRGTHVRAGGQKRKGKTEEIELELIVRPKICRFRGQQ